MSQTETVQEQALRDAIEALSVEGIVVWDLPKDCAQYLIGLRFGVSLPWPNGPDVSELTTAIRNACEEAATQVGRKAKGYGPSWANAGGTAVVYVGFAQQ